MNNLNIPGYRIFKKIGEGGTASVYLGIQEKSNLKVAIKVLDPLLLKDKSYANRFIKEVEAVSRLNHPNIVKIYEAGQVKDIYYIIMECLSENLNVKLSKNGVLPLIDTIKIIKQMASALDYAHSKGIIHRDIKSANILFKEDGVPVIVDFGLARIIDSSMMLTVSSNILGTFNYMSPEQCKGEKAEQMSDIYSLGVVFYELMTGKLPYSSDTPAGIINKHINEPVPLLPSKHGKLNRYQPLVDQMMAKDKRKRIQCGRQVIQLIDKLTTEKIVRDSTTIILPSSDFKKKKNKNKILLALLIMTIVALLIVIGLILIVSRSNKGKENTFHGNNREQKISDLHINKIQSVQPNVSHEPTRSSYQSESQGGRIEFSVPSGIYNDSVELQLQSEPLKVRGEEIGKNGNKIVFLRE